MLFFHLSKHGQQLISAKHEIIEIETQDKRTKMMNVKSFVSTDLNHGGFHQNKHKNKAERIY